MDFVIQYVLETDTTASTIEMYWLVQEQISAVQVLGKVQDVFVDDSMSLFPGDRGSGRIHIIHLSSSGQYQL